MIHSQSPMSMGLNQSFPSSMEFQFLATGSTAGKQTGNVCTTGTSLEMKGKLITEHIIDSSSKFFPADEWVAVEVEVHGNAEIVHRSTAWKCCATSIRNSIRATRTPSRCWRRAHRADLIRPHRLAGRISADLVSQHPDPSARQMSGICLAARAGRVNDGSASLLAALGLDSKLLAGARAPTRASICA
jgi:hypothetical protein